MLLLNLLQSISEHRSQNTKTFNFVFRCCNVKILLCIVRYAIFYIVFVCFEQLIMLFNSLTTSYPVRRRPIHILINLFVFFLICEKPLETFIHDCVHGYIELFKHFLTEYFYKYMPSSGLKPCVLVQKFKSRCFIFSV